MKVVQVNAVCGSGSTGKICTAISDLLSAHNIENYIMYSIGDSTHASAIKISNLKYIKTQALRSRILGNYGFNSYMATKKLVNKLKEINPSIVHLHNLHSHDCNLEMLMNYLKENHIKVYWTFHDCWAFTGYCTHFTVEKCMEWKSECCKCCQWKKYSWIQDRSKYLFNKKKELFQGMDLTIITPSKWLSEVVKDSFLKDYPIKIINNGIDLNVFKPVISNFKEKNGVDLQKKLILGVAFGWGYSKGLDVFIELSKILDENYQIILVGTDSIVDKDLPKNILSIHRTNNQKELAEIYSAADVFLNPTREDTFPTVNIEALACGTPVITSNVGGSPEIIDETSGCVLDCENIPILKQKIIDICEFQEYETEQCVLRAHLYDRNKCFKQYLDLYVENQIKD